MFLTAVVAEPAVSCLKPRVWNSLACTSKRRNLSDLRILGRSQPCALYLVMAQSREMSIRV